MFDLATLLPLIELLLLGGAFAGFLGVGGGIIHVPVYFYSFRPLNLTARS